MGWIPNRDKCVCVRFEVITEVKMSMLAFWTVTLCGLTGTFRRFGETSALKVETVCFPETYNRTRRDNPRAEAGVGSSERSYAEVYWCYCIFPGQREVTCSSQQMMPKLRMWEIYFIPKKTGKLHVNFSLFRNGF
jgi:hypothetical protein